MRLHKNLYYLFNWKPYHKELAKEIENRIESCYYSEDDEKAKEWIKFNVNKNTKYKFPHQDKMNELFR